MAFDMRGELFGNRDELLREQSDRFLESLGLITEISLVDCLNSQISALQAENSKLKEQLTWRPVSEKPEKDGEYFAKHDTSDEPSVLSYKDGVWLFFDYDIAENVITNPPLYWLPIPPAPKGEVK
jgi:hypothetical protein